MHRFLVVRVSIFAFLKLAVSFHVSSVFYFFLRAGGFVALASTLTRVFQVRKNQNAEAAGGVRVAAEKVFQVRFKLFQVRGGSSLDIGGYARQGEESRRNGCKCGEIERN